MGALGFGRRHISRLLLNLFFTTLGGGFLQNKKENVNKEEAPDNNLR